LTGESWTRSNSATTTSTSAANPASTAGFQFEFHCERCNDRWRTAFVRLPQRPGIGMAQQGRRGLRRRSRQRRQCGRRPRPRGLEQGQGRSFQGGGRRSETFISTAAPAVTSTSATSAGTTKKDFASTARPAPRWKSRAARAQGGSLRCRREAALEGIQRGKQMMQTGPPARLSPVAAPRRRGRNSAPSVAKRSRQIILFRLLRRSRAGHEVLPPVRKGPPKVTRVPRGHRYGYDDGPMDGLRRGPLGEPGRLRGEGFC